jgi:HPt (histidine-containing phosphotransfer) domain-containing protein
MEPEAPHRDDDGSLPDIDLARVDELREVDPESTAYIDRAIDNFLGYSRTDLVTLNDAVAADDTEQVVTVAHKLAGRALNLGAVAAGEAVRELEELARAGSLDGALPMLDEVAARLERARNDLVTYRSTWSLTTD